MFAETSLLYNATFHSDKSRVRDETSLHYLRLLLPRGMALLQVTDGGKCLSEANRVLNPLSRTPTRGGVPTCGMFRLIGRANAGIMILRNVARDSHKERA